MAISMELVRVAGALRVNKWRGYEIAETKLKEGKKGKRKRK
jgi:hypothetical protein